MKVYEYQDKFGPQTEWASRNAAAIAEGNDPINKKHSPFTDQV